MKKRDLNYIAALEKAVKEKYGTHGIKNFRSDWDPEDEKKYLDQLKSQQSRSRGQRQERPKEDRTCPECKTYSFSSRDDLYMNRFSCCSLCYEDFVRGMEEKWNNGWRPSDEQMEAALRRRK